MTFINDNFMLQTETARELYHAYAEKMPIIDYHCHLSPQQIAENIQFRDITQLWVIAGHSALTKEITSLNTRWAPSPRFVNSNARIPPS